MLTFLRVIGSRIRGFLGSEDFDRELAEELETHLALAEEEKIRQGMSPKEARRMARVELGGVTQLREASREASGLPWLDSFWLDFKLGFRMLRKSWGLTLVGGLAMTVAISIGVLVFWILEMTFFPTLPLDEGERIVVVQTWDEKASRRRDTSLADLDRWRSRLRSTEDFGGFQTRQRNLVTSDGWAGKIHVAEITASGFQLARVAPLFGRSIVESDQQEDATPVLVIGYEAWKSKFASDPGILGKTVRLGDAVHTVVGVMPEGFAFPLNHGYWTPLNLNNLESWQDAGPDAALFARLAPGATLESAESELLGMGLLAQEDSELGTQLRPRIVPYTFAFTGDFDSGETPWIVRIVLLLITLLLVPPCANIAILIYARTITRQEEFASRFALGASRSRIVGQIFIEVLVLALAASCTALLVVNISGLYLEDLIIEDAGAGVPFWIDFALSFRTILFGTTLAVVAAAIAGVVPALKATGRHMQHAYRALGSHSGLKLGKTWTALVVLQIGLTLAVLPSAVEMGWGTIRKGVIGPGFAAERFLTAQLEVNSDEISSGVMIDRQGDLGTGTAEARLRFDALQDELALRLQRESEILGVTVASAIPGDEPWAGIEVEGIKLESGSIIDNRDLIRFNHVDLSFLGVFEVPVLAGRGFQAGDFDPARRALIVNQTFARLLLGDGNPLGHRVRYTRVLEGQALSESEQNNWYEIVGVVADLPAEATQGTIYHPRLAGFSGPTHLALRVGTDPASFADRLREITGTVSPSLRVDEVIALDEIYQEQALGNNIGATSLGLVTLSVLLLSAAGIYALMSFTVNQRRREIGIRSALGAQPSRLLWGVFNQALLKIALGAVLGSAIALFFDFYLPIEQAGGWNIPFIIPVATCFMALVGLLAAAGPAWRGLRVDPIEELREG